MEIQKLALPRQWHSAPHEAGNGSATVEETVNAIKEDVAVVENGPVYGLAGDAKRPDLQQRIRTIKGERGVDQPLGWTVPFAHAAEAIDTSGVKNDKLRDFAEDPEAMTRVLGGLVFLLAPASVPVKKERNIPDSVIPNWPQPTVQIWSPTGNRKASHLIRAAMAHGVEPVMTSVNRSRHPEITTEREARAFAGKYIGRQAVLHVTRSDAERPTRPRGSYPIVSLEPEALKITRSGCFGISYLKKLLADLPTEVAHPKHFKLPQHPDRVLDLPHLPRQAQALQGEDLRLFTLEHLGLHD